MTDFSGQLLGTSARIHEFFDGKIPVGSIYGEEGSRLYHNFTRGDRAEIDDMLQVAEGTKGDVLELACGTGRMTFPFLAKGYSMVGLDSSPHMLGLLEEGLKESGRSSYAERLSTVESDMSDFHLGRKFGLILLGMTTVWNLDEAQRASLFRCVVEHLDEGGRFLLTLLEFPGLDTATEPFERISVFQTDDAGTPVLCTLFDYVDPVGKARCTSFLAQRAQEGTTVGNAIYGARTHLVSPAALTEEMRQAGLRVIETHETGSRNKITANTGDGGRRRLLLEVGR